MYFYVLVCQLTAWLKRERSAAEEREQNGKCLFSFLSIHKSLDDVLLTARRVSGKFAKRICNCEGEGGLCRRERETEKFRDIIICARFQFSEEFWKTFAGLKFPADLSPYFQWDS